jgi:predicted secreted hydrolase
LEAVAFTQDGVKIAIDLVLKDTQGPTLQGDRGYSQKGPEVGNASYYYSLVSLESRGILSFGEDEYSVQGSSWMDHEFSTSALAPDQVGWDWTSLQLDNGSELMFFQIRKADGSIDPFSSGTMVMPDGTQEKLSSQDFTIEVLDTWRSPETKATYPARWKVELPKFEISLEITPVLPDQELNVSYAYWEGAVDIRGEFAGIGVSGVGYVELTGYAGSMAGQF